MCAVRRTEYCRRCAKLLIFSIPHPAHWSWSFSVEFGITGYYNPGRLWHAASHDTDLSCHCTVPLFVALCDNNPPTLQTERQTDGRHARSIAQHEYFRRKPG